MRPSVAVGMALVALAMDCRKPSRRYASEEVVGQYSYAAKNEGLILQKDGAFEHCWRVSGRSESEHGKWELFDEGETSTSVTLFHSSSGVGGFPMEGLSIQDIAGHVGLVLPGEQRGAYYVKLDSGQRACPRGAP